MPKHAHVGLMQLTLTLAIGLGAVAGVRADGPAARPPADEPMAFASDLPTASRIGDTCESDERVSPLAKILIESGRILTVTQALEELPEAIPNPAPMERPSQAPRLVWPELDQAAAPDELPGQPMIEPMTEPARVEASALSKPMFTLTLDSAAAPELERRMGTLAGEFAIQDESLERFGSWQAPVEEATLAPARFAPTQAQWAASAVYTRPLYFEQANVERYGHYAAWCEKDNLTQSAISAAHFFATVPMMPYKLGAQPPDQCSYVLGAYRPGSCNPHQLLCPELSARGLLYQGLSVTGLVFLIP